MITLKFNDEFNSVIEEPISCWKKTEDIPQNIKNFIIENSDSIPLYDEKNNKYYCPKCIEELTEYNKCPKCSKRFLITDKYNSRINIEDINKIRDLSHYFYYYVFDIIDDNVLLYVLSEYVSYDNPLSYYPYKNSEITIKNIYQVLSNEIIDFQENKHYSYEKLKDIKERFESDDEFSNDEFESYQTMRFEPYYYQYLYTDNLNELRNVEIYKYSNIWLLKDFFNKNDFCLSSLTYFPVYYKEFEYLVKIGFYDLALNYCDSIKYGGSFKKTFGVDKKYYQFMKDININYSQLEALRLCNTSDIKIINFVSDNFYIFDVILKYTDIISVYEYFQKQNLSNNNIDEYYDYIICCEKLKLNLSDKSILFPKNFIEQHDKITSELIISNNPEINNRIESLSNVISLNNYEDDNFVIFPANSVNSLIDESSQQSNCVRTYCDRVSNNECQIYFMRYKSNINKSFVTIEVRNGKVVQARTKFNEEPNIEIMNIIKKWERTLIMVVN